MITAIAFLALLGVGIWVFYKLASMALRSRANLRAGARLGPGAFFLEVTDQKPEQPTSPEK